METVLLHGLGQTPESFLITAKWMEREVRCPSLKELMGEETSYSSLYQGFSAYCDGLNGPLALAGLSLGGILALNYALQNPERVGALALIATPYKMPKGLMTAQDFLFHLMPQSAFKRMGFSKKEVLSLTRSMQDLDFTDGLSSLQPPVLLICGGKDKQNLKIMEELGKRLSTDLIVLENAGHEVNLAESERLGDLLKEFFQKAENR